MDETAIKYHLQKACRLADCFLWESFSRSWPSAWPGDWRGGGGRLVFPLKHDKDELWRRVSEQEARFCFVEALAQSPFYYSVETPTQNPIYPKAGLMDLSLYSDPKGIDRRWNIEFKQSASTSFWPEADMNKLLAENCQGLGFYLFDIDSMREGLEFCPHRYTTPIKRDILNTKTKYGEKCKLGPTITIHMCFLYQGFSLHREVPVDTQSDLEASLAIDMRSRQSGDDNRCVDLEIKDLNGWLLHHQEPLGWTHPRGRGALAGR